MKFNFFKFKQIQLKKQKHPPFLGSMNYDYSEQNCVEINKFSSGVISCF